MYKTQILNPTQHNKNVTTVLQIQHYSVLHNIHMILTTCALPFAKIQIELVI